MLLSGRFGSMTTFICTDLHDLEIIEKNNNNNNNFAHYFSVKDPNMETDFRCAIHGWRSYYIVNVLDVCCATDTTPAQGSDLQN